MTAVKDQELCASSWAFSAIGSIESQYAVKTGHLLPLSVQNVVDCAGLYGANGCAGGFPTQALKYVNHHGIFTEEAYPYDGRTHDYCKLTVPGAKKPNVTVHGITRISRGDENDLQTALALHGPISVAIDARHESFYSYEEGIWHEPNCSHEANAFFSVLLIGYGTDEFERDYWILKNFFGTNWGERGYFRMSRNQNNHCGIASKAIFPNV